MLEDRKKRTNLISSIGYLILLIIYIVTLFIPFVTDYELTGWDWPLINFTAFIPGGYFGMVLLFISNYYISKYKFLRFLTMSVISSIALGINYILLYYNEYQDNINGYHTFRYSLNFFVNFGLWIIIVMYNLIFIYIYFRQKYPKNELRLRKLILDQSTKKEQISIKELCILSDLYDITVVRVIKDILKNKQINGEYFKATRTLQLNVKENLEEIDKLMALYKEWEELKIKKIA